MKQSQRVQLNLTIHHLSNAGVAQLVEQFTCNEQVAGAEPATSSKEII